MAKYFTKDGDNYVEVSDNLLTQTEVDSVVESRLERDRKKFADYEDLKTKAASVDTIKSEYETKLKEKDTSISDLNKKLGSTQLEVDKVKIVHEFGLSDDLHEFVVGENADEMRQRAEKLAKGVKGGTIKIDKTKKPGEQPSDNKAIAGKLFGSRKADD